MKSDEIKGIMEELRTYLSINEEELLNIIDSYIVKLERENKELQNARYSLDKVELEKRINKAIDSYENRDKYKKKRFFNGLDVADLMYEILKG